MKQKSYDELSHFYGKLWIWTAIVLLLSVPVSICIYYDAWPGLTPVLKGLLGVAPIFWTVGTIEVITFTPMLGTGGSYLAFITGNLTNLKVPGALSAMENAKVKSTTEEGEIISTIAVATSSIVTTIIIAIGVLLLAQLAPMIFMILLFLCVPSLSGSVGVLVPVGALISIGAARVLYKKNKL